MRITNKMMTNNSMSHINTNKNLMSKLEEQYSSQKKIQRPSDDPIIAVRALKLRSNLAQLNQYYEKNIPDAKAWMEVTESAMKNVNGILTSINTYCNQGASDTLTKDDRNSIIQNITQLKDQIYQEGNTNYAGRYVFTGYKTDNSLIYNEKTSLPYNITEEISGEQIEIKSLVSDCHKVSEYNPATSTGDDFEPASSLQQVYRIRLSYEDLDAATVTLSGFAGTVQTVSETSTAPDPYEPAAGGVNFIPETGELILSETVYNSLRAMSNISITYNKTEFAKGDLRPENYFTCTATTADGPINYVNDDQPIDYEVNFSQSLTVNTEGKDSIQHAIGRDIDEIQKAAKSVEDTENQIASVKKLLSDESLTTQQKEALTKLSEQLDTELVLKNKILQEKFSEGMTKMSEHQNTMNVALADLGSRYVRLELTESRLGDQQVEFEDLMSTNEDADMVETLVRYNSQEQVYNASLSAAAKIVKNTLLDFI